MSIEKFYRNWVKCCNPNDPPTTSIRNGKPYLRDFDILNGLKSDILY